MNDFLITYMGIETMYSEEILYPRDQYLLA